MYELSAFHRCTASCDGCMSCWHFATVLHLVMGTWIARLAGWWPMLKSYIYCCFLAKRNTFSYDFWVSWPVAEVKVVCLLLFSHKKKHFFHMSFGLASQQLTLHTCSHLMQNFDICYPIILIWYDLISFVQVYCVRENKNKKKIKKNI